MKKEFASWIAVRIEQGSARVLPHGTFEVVPLRSMEAKLSSIYCLQELEGFANRRRYNPDLPKWTEAERGAILARKLELEILHGIKRK